jgi:AraC-like DNA-binding protein
MLIETTSLALAVYRVGETLEVVYDIDPRPVYRELGIDPDGPSDPGERVSNRIIAAMFEAAQELSGDPAVGIRVGSHSELRHFFVISHVWLASSNLVESIERLLRYEEILNSGDTELSFEKAGDHYVLSESYPNPVDYPGKLRVDAGIATILRLCSIARGRPVLADRLEVLVPEDEPIDIYLSLVREDVRRHRQHNAMYLAAEDLEPPLQGAIPAVAESTSKIAEQYLATLDSSSVAHRVRAELIQLLPGGDADQDKIAARLYRSASTLQRQLSSEGLTYRQVLDETRRELAEAYLRDGSHSQAQIAFLLGYSDQANFARAFKRWSGVTPGEFARSISPGAARPD